MRNVLVFFFLILVSSSRTWSQTPSAAANRFLTKAQNFYLQKNLKKAEAFFKKSLSAAPSSPEIYAVLGKFYMDQGRFADAAYIYESGARMTTDGMQRFALPLAKALHRAENYEKAGSILRSYKIPNNASDALKTEIEELKKAIDFGRVLSYHATKAEPVNLGVEVNSKFDDYFPSLSLDQRSLLFTRKNNGVDEDFFETIFDSCNVWTTARDLGFPLNSSNPEGALVRSYNGRYLIFQKCDNRTVNGWELGGCDLYLAYKKEDTWSDPRPFGYTINTTAFEGMPSLSSDDGALYFVSDRDGGFGGKDIWVSYFKDGYWQVPQNLGPSINTAQDETAPTIAADNKTLYFTSKGHPGFGGKDLFMSQRNGDSSWSKAVNLGAPINSNFDEASCAISIDGSTMYFSSNRPGGSGGMDIYQVALPEQVRPEKMRFVYGRVLDYTSKTIVPKADILLTNATTGVPYLQFKSNRGDASFYAPMQDSLRMAVEIEARNYELLTDTIFLAHSAQTVDTIDFFLFPEGYEQHHKIVSLLNLDFSDSSLFMEDSFCLMINRALLPYSGKILNLEMNVFMQMDSLQQILFDPSKKIKECLYKIGLENEHFFIKNWQGTKERNERTAWGKVEFILKYLE